MSKEKKKGGWKRGLLIALIVILAVVLLTAVAGVIFVNVILDKIPRANEEETLSAEQLESIAQETDAPDPEFTGPIVNPEDIITPEQAFEKIPVDGDNIVNVLLVGQDGEGTTGQRRSRSDSMILCTLNKKEKTLTLTSFMRDMYVKIPGYYSQRINVAYAVGGFPALYDTLEYNFGLSVDYGVAVNFSTFKEVIDMVGGIDIELTAAEANYINNIGYAVGNVWCYSSVVPGMNCLNGQDALTYSRIRKIGDDFGRTERQRKVINQLVEKAKTLPLDRLYEMVETLLPMVVTDMSNAEIISCALQFAPYLQDITVISQRIPADGTYRHAGVNGMRVLLPDLEANHQILMETLGLVPEEETTP